MYRRWSDKDFNCTHIFLCFDREMDSNSNVIISMCGNQTSIETNKVRFAFNVQHLVKYLNILNLR